MSLECLRPGGLWDLGLSTWTRAHWPSPPQRANTLHFIMYRWKLCQQQSVNGSHFKSHSNYYEISLNALLVFVSFLCFVFLVFMQMWRHSFKLLSHYLPRHHYIIHYITRHLIWRMNSISMLIKALIALTGYGIHWHRFYQWSFHRSPSSLILYRCTIPLIHPFISHSIILHYILTRGTHAPSFAIIFLW